MTYDAARWETAVTALWSRLDEMSAIDFVALVDELADVGPDAGPALRAAALFERACARDSVGWEDQAEPLYRAALASAELDPYRRSRASIQLASTLRLLGRLDESEQLLVAELDSHLHGKTRELHDEARAILALTYVAQGRSTKAAGLALFVLAPHLSRYNRSMKNYARELAGNTWE